MKKLIFLILLVEVLKGMNFTVNIENLRSYQTLQGDQTTHKDFLKNINNYILNNSPSPQELDTLINNAHKLLSDLEKEYKPYKALLIKDQFPTRAEITRKVKHYQLQVNLLLDFLECAFLSYGAGVFLDDRDLRLSSITIMLSAALSALYYNHQETNIRRICNEYGRHETKHQDLLKKIKPFKQWYTIIQNVRFDNPQHIRPLNSHPHHPHKLTGDSRSMLQEFNQEK